MIKRLIINQWREITRSSMWTRNLIANILIGLLFLVMMVNFFAVGMVINKLLAQTFPGKDPVNIINSVLLYYLLFDLMIRLIFQKNHGIEVKPYLFLPIKRKTLISYLLSKSFISIFNFLPLFLIVPFMIQAVIPAYSLFQGLSWLASFFFILLFNCFLAVYIKKSEIKNSKAIVITALVLFTSAVLQKYGIISIASISMFIFGGVITNPVFMVIPAAAFIILYYLDYNLLRENFYLHNLDTGKKIRFRSFKLFDLLDALGETGKYASLEMKLLLRNKRSRNSIFFSSAMIVLGVTLYPTYLPRAYYPSPSKSNLEFVSNYKSMEKKDSTNRFVTFRVIPGNLPKNATVYIAGNQKILRNWEPDGFALERRSDSSWSGSIPVKINTELDYKVTLGSWDLEQVNKNGKSPGIQKLTVTADTTIDINANYWKSSGTPSIYLAMLFYFGIIMTGMFLLTYGQFILSWESTYFDAIITKRINFLNYLRAKYFIMMAAGIIFYILTLPYGFYGLRIIQINAAAALYNIGVNSFGLMFMATFNRKRFDLNASMMSSQGKGAGQYLSVVPSLIIPTAIFIPFALAGYINEALVVFASLGILGIIFQKQLLNIILKQFYRQKYKIAAGFRQVY